MRYALITAPAAKVRAYLPDNFHVLLERDEPTLRSPVTLVGGQDSLGWGLDTYVLPRLASGRYFGREISVTGAVNFKNGSHVDICT